MTMKIDQHLAEAITWAEERLRNGAEPPFIYYRLMQLREAAMELQDHARRLSEISPGSEGLGDSARQTAASERQPNIVLLRSDYPPQD